MDNNGSSPLVYRETLYSPTQVARVRFGGNIFKSRHSLDTDGELIVVGSAAGEVANGGYVDVALYAKDDDGNFGPDPVQLIPSPGGPWDDWDFAGFGESVTLIPGGELAIHQSINSLSDDVSGANGSVFLYKIEDDE